MEYFPIALLGLFCVIIVTRPLTVLLHELGHALPAMWLTKQGATVFVGSYGDKKSSFHIKMRSLEIWVRFNPLKWGGGRCVLIAEDVPPVTRVIYVASGPILSFLLVASICYLTFSNELHGSLKVIFIVMLFSSIVDLVASLIPHTFMMPDGTLGYTDGYLLLYGNKLDKFPIEFNKALAAYEERDFDNSAKLFDSFVKRDLLTEDIHRMAFMSHIFLGNYQKAYSIQKDFEIEFNPGSIDYYNMALTCGALHLASEKEFYYKKSIEAPIENADTLNNIGYDYIAEARFEEAIVLFDKVIEFKDDFAFAYNNRGHAKMETGNLEEGLSDVQHSLQLDSNNAYAYRSLGIYHLFKQDKEAAMRSFMQAKEMDNQTESINEYIQKASS